MRRLGKVLWAALAAALPACGGSSGTGTLRCSAGDSGFLVALSGASGGAATRACGFDDFGRPVKLAISYQSGHAVTCADIQHNNLGQVVRATCWTADGASACTVPAGGTPIPFDPSFAWGCRSPDPFPPDFYAGCAWTGATSTIAGPPPTASNSADLSGAELGDSPDDLTVLRKSVPVVVTGPIPGIGIETAFAIRRTPLVEVTELVVPVRNQGTAAVCGLSFFGYRWLDTSGGVVPSLVDMYPYASLRGSLARDGAFIDSTCLRPGELGYVLESEAGTSAEAKPFTELASVALDFTPLTPDPAPDPPAGLVPESYDAGTCEGEPAVKVIARNAGTGPVWLATAGIGGWVVALDGEGVPAGYGLLGAPHPGAIAPGATVELIGFLGRYSPRVSRVHVYTEFSTDF